MSSAQPYTLTEFKAAEDAMCEILSTHPLCPHLPFNTQYRDLPAPTTRRALRPEERAMAIAFIVTACMYEGEVTLPEAVQVAFAHLASDAAVMRVLSLREEYRNSTQDDGLALGPEVTMVALAARRAVWACDAWAGGQEREAQAVLKVSQYVGRNWGAQGEARKGLKTA